MDKFYIFIFISLIVTALLFDLKSYNGKNDKDIGREKHHHKKHCGKTITIM